jgi:hypothetical protein
VKGINDTKAGGETEGHVSVCPIVSCLPIGPYTESYGFVCHLVLEWDPLSIFSDDLSSFISLSEIKDDRSVFFHTHSITLWAATKLVLLTAFPFLCSHT